MKLYRPAFRPDVLSVIVVCSLVLAAALAMMAVSGCSHDRRRLSEKEALDYKRDLIRQGELSAPQVNEFGSDTRRRKAEIDALYNKLSADSAVERAKERAYWENVLRREGAIENVEP